MYFSSAPSSPGARNGSQTFHSSKQILGTGTEGGILAWMRAIWMREAADSMAVSACRGERALGRCLDEVL